MASTVQMLSSRDGISLFVPRATTEACASSLASAGKTPTTATPAMLTARVGKFKEHWRKMWLNKYQGMFCVSEDE
jgi:hypothetical protein